MREIIIIGDTMQRARFGLDSVTRIIMKIDIPCKRYRDKLYIANKITFIIASSYNIDKVMIGRRHDLSISDNSCKDEKFILEIIKYLLEKEGK